MHGWQRRVATECGPWRVATECGQWRVAVAQEPRGVLLTFLTPSMTLVPRTGPAELLWKVLRPEEARRGGARARGRSMGVQAQMWEDAGWSRRPERGPSGYREECSGRGKRGFREEGDWSMKNLDKTPPGHSSATPTVQVRHPQERAKSHRVLITSPSLI